MVRDAKERDVRTAVFYAILVGIAALFWLKQTDHDLFSFFVAQDFMDASPMAVWIMVFSTLLRDFGLSTIMTIQYVHDLPSYFYGFWM